MTPELETLDQLLGGELPLTVISQLFPDKDAFVSGMLGLLSCGDVRLLDVERVEVPTWRWRELFKQGGVVQGLDQFRLEITDQGIKKIS